MRRRSRALLRLRLRIPRKFKKIVSCKKMFGMCCGGVCCAVYSQCVGKDLLINKAFASLRRDGVMLKKNMLLLHLKIASKKKCTATVRSHLSHLDAEMKEI